MNGVQALQPITNNKLNDKQLLFIAEYINNGFNATKACIDAGYKTKAPDK